MAVRLLVREEMVGGEARVEASEWAKWRGVVVLMLMVEGGGAVAEAGEEKFMVAVEMCIFDKSMEERRRGSRALKMGMVSWSGKTGKCAV